MRITVQKRDDRWWACLYREDDDEVPELNVTAPTYARAMFGLGVSLGSRSEFDSWMQLEAITIEDLPDVVSVADGS